MENYGLYPIFTSETLRQTELLREAEEQRKRAAAKAARREARKNQPAVVQTLSGKTSPENQEKYGKEQLKWN